MGKALDYIKTEKEHYGSMLYNINSAISDISPFIEVRELNSRKFVTRVPVLKSYIEALADMERIENKEGVLGFLNDDKHIKELEDYKMKNSEALSQAEKCNKCTHLKCPPGCKLVNCLDCRQGSWVAYCDHKKISVRLHDNFTLGLNNDRTGTNERYKVLTTIEDVEKDRQYIITEGLVSREKFVLYYYPGLIEDSFGEISDEEEFNYIVSFYENIER